MIIHRSVQRVAEKLFVSDELSDVVRSLSTGTMWDGGSKARTYDRSCWFVGILICCASFGDVPAFSYQPRAGLCVDTHRDTTASKPSHTLVYLVLVAATLVLVVKYKG